MEMRAVILYTKLTYFKCKFYFCTPDFLWTDGTMRLHLLQRNCMFWQRVNIGSDSLKVRVTHDE